MSKKKDWSHLPNIHNTVLVDGLAVIDGVKHIKCRVDGCDNLSPIHKLYRHSIAPTTCGKCIEGSAKLVQRNNWRRKQDASPVIRYCANKECGRKIIIPFGGESQEYKRRCCSDECSVVLRRASKRLIARRSMKVVNDGKHGWLTRNLVDAQQRISKIGGANTPTNIIAAHMIFLMVKHNTLTLEKLKLLKQGNLDFAVNKPRTKQITNK